VVGAVIGAGCVAAALVLPWLSLLPLHGVAATLAHAITLVAAFHGAGLVISRLARQKAAAPLLIVQWGIATLIGLSGIAIAVHAGTLATHTGLVFGFAAVHTGIVGHRFARHAERAAQSLAGPRAWMVPAALLAMLGTLAVLGAAGDTLARPFDDEGHVLAQLRRVLDTGQLGDPIGYPRNAQLGGQIAFAAIVSGAGDGLSRIGEALALVLTLGLALGLTVSRIRPRDPSAALWATLLIVTAFALALAPTDPLPCWTAAGLIVALHAMGSQAEPPPPLPLAITAGALIALRYEFAPIAAVAVIAAWWPRRGSHRTTALLIGGVLAVGAPLFVARMAAWHALPLIAHAAIAPRPHAALALRILLAAAIAAPAACVLRLALPRRRALRWAAITTALALGAIAARVTGAGPYSMRLVWPIAIAFGITLVIELAQSRRSSAAAFITLLVLCVLLQEGREAPGRLRWSRRLAAMATNIEALQRPPGDGAAPYAELLANVPPGATVALWVAKPERIDYARHRFVDLRTPAGARLREFRWAAHTSRLAPLLAQLSAAFLLVEADDARVLRTQTDLLYRFACQTPRPICADDLEAIALDHRVIAERAGVRLIDLRPP
jgi:hypothetical protein